MKKIILIIIIVCACFSCGMPKKVRKAFTYCYTGTYTGIDTLINMEGRYSGLIFYDNGMVVIPSYGYVEKLFGNKDSLLFKEIMENPETKSSKKFYNINYNGSYVICGDTIKVQLIYKPSFLEDNLWEGDEKWYKIIDKNTLLFLGGSILTTDKKEKEFQEKHYPHTYRGGSTLQLAPLSYKPLPEYFWILKEKWFWCNESDWKKFMEKMNRKRLRINE